MNAGFGRDPRYLLWVDKAYNVERDANDYAIVVQGPADEIARTTIDGPLTPENIVGALRQLADVVEAAEAARKPQEAPSDPG